MKVILLAGGLGTRLAEFTDIILNQWFMEKNLCFGTLCRYMQNMAIMNFTLLGYKSEVIKSIFKLQIIKFRFYC